MSYLVDTHIFLWSVGDSGRLDATIREAIEAPESRVFVSVVSAWEIAIKVGLGKLEFPMNRMAELMATMDFDVLPVRLDHSVAYSVLPIIHRDPFDRMLIAQAQAEGMVLLTQDETLMQYPGIDGSGKWRVMDAARRSNYLATALAARP